MKTANIISKPDASQSNVWDFPVHQERLQTSTGVKSDIWGVVRGDTGKVIGQYRGEKMLRNTDVVETFETMLRNNGQTFERVNALTTKDGARFFARYKVGADTKIIGESYSTMINVSNSYDGTLSQEYEAYMMRIACFNGAYGLSRIAQANGKKHSFTFSIESQTEKFFAEMLQTQYASRETIEKMDKIKINDIQAENILSNMVERGVKFGFGERHAVLVNRNWQNPTQDEKSLGNTLYRLFNAGTRYARDIERNGRFELSQRTGLFIGDAIGFSLRRNSFESEMMKPSAVKIDFADYASN